MLLVAGRELASLGLMKLILLLLMNRRNRCSITRNHNRSRGHSGNRHHRQNCPLNLQRLRVRNADIPISTLLLTLLLLLRQLIRNNHLSRTLLSQSLTLNLRLLLPRLTLLLLLLLLMVQHRLR